MATHYDVLGVPKGASPTQVREAYRARARLLHPDRLIDASAREQEAAAREMARVNEAWRVLGDARRRRTYDESLEPSGTRHYAETTLGLDDELGGTPATVTLVRALPWLILALVLGLIFVFTAYAGPGSDDDAPGTTSTRAPAGSAPVELGDCVSIDGATVVATPCEGDSDGQVVAVVGAPSACPADTRAVLLPAEDRVVCVAG